MKVGVMTQFGGETSAPDLRRVDGSRPRRARFPFGVGTPIIF